MADPKPSASNAVARKSRGTEMPAPIDTIPARKAIIGPTYDALTAAQRLLAAGYDEPCLHNVVAGKVL